MSVEWDGIRDLHTAICAPCADTFTSTRLDEVEDWTDTHRCDPELVALLAEITTWWAA